MVNFNNETTVTRTKREILIFLIIEMRHYVLESLELYNKQKYQNQVPNAEPALRARIHTLFNYVRSSLNKDLSEEDFKQIEDNLSSEEFQDFIGAFYTIDQYLFEKDIVKFYSNIDYDPSDPTQEDEAKEV